MHASKKFLKVRHTRLIFTVLHYISTYQFFHKSRVLLKARVQPTEEGFIWAIFYNIYSYLIYMYCRKIHQGWKKTTHCHIYDKSENKTRLLQSKIIKFQDFISWTIDCISKSGSDRPPYDSTCCFLVSFP